MNTKVFGKALSVIGSVMAVIWGAIYFDAKKTYESMHSFSGGYESLFFPDIKSSSKVEALASNGLTVALIGVGLLAFGLLLIYFSNSNSNNNTPKEEDKNS